MKQIKRVLAILTAAFMIVNLLPAAALAKEAGSADGRVAQAAEDPASPPQTPSEPTEEKDDPAPSPAPPSGPSDPAQGTDASGDVPSGGTSPDSASLGASPSSEPDALSFEPPQLVTHDFGNGYGTRQAIPISTAEELSRISAANNQTYPLWGNYFLTNDITLSSDFSPIGWGVVREGFTGLFDGCGHAITYNKTVDEPADQVALFQIVGSEEHPSALVENLTIKGGIEGSRSYASVQGHALAIENHGLIRNVKVNDFSVSLVGAESNGTCFVGTNHPTGVIELCEINAGSQVLAPFCGGFAILNQGTMESCINNGKVGENSAGLSISTIGAAGITLNMNGGKLESCSNQGAVSGNGTMETGGIVAQVKGNAAINLCNNHGVVSVNQGDAAGVGGIAGLVMDTTQITSCVNEAKINSKVENTGGIAGKVGALTEEHWLIERCENRGSVTGVDKTGGIVGMAAATVNYAGRVLNCKNFGDVHGGERTGGVVGENGAVVGYAENQGDVSGSSKVGGVVGDNGTSGVAEFLLNYGDVAGAGGDVGGIAGISSAHQLNFKLDIGLAHYMGSAGNYGDVTAGGDGCGGVLGDLSGGSLSSVFNEGDVDGEGDVGGVVGDAYDQSVNASYNTGIVRGRNRVGGIVGDGAGTPTGTSMTDVLSLGRVEAKPDAVNVGILMGYHSASSSIKHLYHCYYNVDVMEPGMKPYGNNDLNGYDSNVEGMHTGEMTGYELQDELTHNGYVSFTFRSNESGPGLDPVQGRSTTWKHYYPQITEMREQLGCSFPETYVHDFESENTDGKAGEPVYETFTYIETVADLQKIANNPDGNFVLKNNIQLPDKDDNLPSIGTFTGSFDGVGHEISGIRSAHGLVDNLMRKNIPLVPNKGSGGKLLNITLSGTIENTSAKELGALCGVASSDVYIYGCVNKATITDNDNVGGIVGNVVGAQQDGVSIENCENAGAVTGNNNVGGIVGDAVDEFPLLQTGTIARCVNSGTVNGKQNVGGIAGQTNLLIEGCQNTGAVQCKGGNVAGGIVGLLTYPSESAAPVQTGHLGMVQGCMSGETATVTGVTETPPGSEPNEPVPGDMTGLGDGNVVGGNVGRAEGCTRIEAAYNAGSVEGYMYVGGVAGEIVETAGLTACCNAGSLLARGSYATMGGLIGFFDSTGTVQTSYNTGTLSTASDTIERLGGLVGWHNGKGYLKDCYSAGRIPELTDSKDAGAIAGMGAGNEAVGAEKIVNCYYDNVLCKLPGVVYGREGDSSGGRSVYDMTTREFSDVSDWNRMNNGTKELIPGTYGYLYGQMLYYPMPVGLSQGLGHYGLSAPAPYIIAKELVNYWGVQHETYTGKPLPFTLELPHDPAYTVAQYGTRKPDADSIQNQDDKYTWSADAPKVPGDYKVKVTITEPYYEANGINLDLSVAKAPCTATPNDKVVWVDGDWTKGGFPYKAEGLVNGESSDVLDHVEFGIEGGAPQVGDTPIVPVGEFSDDCYELTAGEGTLTIKPYYEIEGEKVTHNGVDWYVNGPATIKIFEDPEQPYDRISDDGQTWREEIVLESEHGETFHKTLYLKNSQNGAQHGNSFDETINVCSGVFDYDLDPSNLHRSWAPESNTLKMKFTQNVEVLPDAYFEVYVNDELFEKVTADKIVVENNQTSGGRYIATASIPLSRIFPANAHVSVKNDPNGSFTSVYGAKLSPIGQWVFDTSLYNGEVVFDKEQFVATYDGKPHGVTYSVRPENEYVDEPHVSIAYESSDKTSYPKTETPPTLPGYYTAWAALDDPLYDSQPAMGASLTIEKKELTLTADDKTMYFGEQVPELTYKADGLIESETAAVLDDVSLAVDGAEPLAPGTYAIDFATYEDNCYEITPVAGTLSVKQDKAEGRYKVSGTKGGNGHDDWYVSTVTIRPDGRDGYDFISDNGGKTWSEELSYASDDAPKELDLELLLKKSATGAVTSPARQAVKLYTKELTADGFSPVVGELYHDPSESTISFTLNQPVEKGRGYFTVTDADGNEFASLNVKALRVAVSRDGKTVTLHLPDPFEPYGTYTVACGAGVLYSQTYGKRFEGIPQGKWTFTVSGSSDTVRITDLMLDVDGERDERRAAYVGKDNADYAAALEDGTSALAITPKVSGVLADDRIGLEVQGGTVVMMDGSQAPADAVTVSGKHLAIKENVKSVIVKVTAYGQTASDSTTILLQSTGWAAAVLDNQTQADIRTSNILEAIDPTAVLLGNNEIAVATLTITPLPPENLPAGELDLLREGAGESVLGSYFSIELTVEVFKKDDPAASLRKINLDVTQQPILFWIQFPDDGLTHVNERMLRLHDEMVDELRVAVLEDGTRAFASDMFSTYAPAYDVLRAITVEQPEHGTVTVDRQAAIKGETIAVATEPDEGYELRKITVNGSPIEGNTFTMPDEDVVVSAIFAQPGEPDPPLSPNGNGVAPTGDSRLPMRVWAIAAFASAVVAVWCARKRARR